ncbi:MAG TPA: CHRD domain-containing protein [Caldimonas sp.]|nr:CHRD domain-containing protein [Caldimonas sp.]
MSPSARCSGSGTRRGCCSTAHWPETRLFDGLLADEAYLNIHTTQFPSGEIRGFLATVPEPQSYALMLAGLALTGAMLRRRRHRFAAAPRRVPTVTRTCRAGSRSSSARSPRATTASPSPGRASVAGRV